MVSEIKNARASSYHILKGSVSSVDNYHWCYFNILIMRCVHFFICKWGMWMPCIDCWEQNQDKQSHREEMSKINATAWLSLISLSRARQSSAATFLLSLISFYRQQSFFLLSFISSFVCHVHVLFFSSSLLFVFEKFCFCSLLEFSLHFTLCFTFKLFLFSFAFHFPFCSFLLCVCVFLSVCLDRESHSLFHLTLICDTVHSLSR